MPRSLEAASSCPGGISRHLEHPLLIGVRHDPRDLDLPTLEVNEQHDGVRHHATQREDLHAQAVGAHPHSPMPSNELRPPCGRLPFGHRRYPLSGDQSQAIFLSLS